MVVRGAPAIGATAAFGLAIGVHDAVHSGGRWSDISLHYERLARTRPTAVNLLDGLQAISSAIGLDHTNPPSDRPLDPEVAKKALAAAQEYADTDAQRCASIGQHGLPLFRHQTNVLTHCNAGWLACVDWGTALSPIYAAQRAGKEPRVWADETRPRGQGRRLTAWELVQEGIPCTVLPDSAAASVLRQGAIDLVITGADRIAANGDVANKIGTYPLALAAREAGVPFWVAAPVSTLDPNCASGEQIPIETRGPEEVTHVWGIDDNGTEQTVRVVAQGAEIHNPAFDMTPAGLIQGIITEVGRFPASPTGMQQWLDSARSFAVGTHQANALQASP